MLPQVLFQLGIFSDPAFLEFAGRVKECEDREIAGTPEPEAGPTGPILSPTSTRVDQVVACRVGPINAKLDTLLARLDTVPAVSTVPAATAAEPVEPVGAPAGRKTVHQHAAAVGAKRGPGGVPVYVLSVEKSTVAELWAEYTVGIGTGPAVRLLEGELTDRSGVPTVAGGTRGGGTATSMRR